jgi:hypothetical protein
MNSAVQDLAAEALFASDLQPSECPNEQAIALTVTAMVLCYGSDGCADDVAAEFGDHPEAAVRRMSWARHELAGIASWSPPDRVIARAKPATTRPRDGQRRS